MSNTRKKFLLDTSVILDDPQNLISLYQNGLNELFISNIILDELNGHKEDGFNEKGFFAREFIRALDAGILTTRNDQKIKVIKTHVSASKQKSSKDKLVKENPLKEGEDSIYGFQCLFENTNNPVLINIINREHYKKENYTNDLKIVEIAKDYNLSLITNDIALKFISLSKGIESDSLKKGSVNNPEEIEFKKEYNIRENFRKEDLLEIMKKESKFNQIICTVVNDQGLDTGKKEFYLADPYKEQPSLNDENKVAAPKEWTPLKMDSDDFSNYKVQPINLEQKFLLRMLSDPASKISVVTGSTGSGKTLMALQEGVRRVEDKDEPIDVIIYLRNTVNSNDKASELGFRKGDQNQKLNYFAYPLFGSVNFILDNTISKKKLSLKDDYQDKNRNSTSKEEHTEQFMKDYNIEVMDLAHARGVTLTNKYVMFDELQNASNATLQLLGTRLGKNSKLVLLGDYKQVDHPYLTKYRNALVAMLKFALTDDKIGGIQLRKTIRSDIAEWFQQNL